MRARTTTKQAGALAALALALTLIAAGCGSAASSAGRRGVSPAVALARAAGVSSGAAGERVTFSMTLSSPSLSAPAQIQGSGSFQPAAGAGQLTVAMDLGGDPAASAALGSSTVTLHEVLERDVVYIELPAALSGRIPGAKPWLELDLPALASKLGDSGPGSLLDDPLTTNPAAFLQYLRAVSGRVERVASATIDGRPTTEYRAVIDLRRVPSQVPSARRAAVARAIATLQKITGLRNVPVDAWLDSQRRVRRLALSFAQAPTGGQRVGIAMTLNVLSYGPQPAPQIPPASQVTNLTSLLGGLASTTAG